VGNLTDKDALIETLLQERDELYQELSKLRQADGGALEKAEKKNARYEELLKEKDRLIKKLTDQLAWLRRKFWKASSEKYIPADPAQRKIDFDGLEILPEEEETINSAASEIITYKRNKREHARKQPVRLPLP
jgi:hypothetical protein